MVVADTSDEDVESLDREPTVDDEVEELIEADRSGETTDCRQRVLAASVQCSRPTVWLLQRIQSRWPLFRYGFVVTLLAGLTPLFNVPGATFTIGFFLTDFMEALDMTRSQLSLAWTVGMLGTAFVGPLIGRTIDLFGPKFVMFLAAVFFAGVLVFIANMTMAFQVFVAFFLVRLGTNTVSAAASNANNQWWIKARARATSVVVAMSSLSFVYPSLLFVMREHLSWRDCWLLQAVAVLVAYLLISFLLLDRPETFGYRPDEAAAPAPTDTDTASPTITVDDSEVHWRWQDALSTAWFWAITSGMFLCYVHWGGFNFHYLEIIAERGLQSDAASYVFPLTSVTSFFVALFAGQLFDRLHHKAYAVVLGLSSCALSLALLLALLLWPSAVVLNLFALFYGSFVGVLMVAGQMIFASAFGRIDLATIQSVNAGANTIAIGVGPVLYGLSKDLWGSFDPILLLLLIVIVINALAVFFLPAPAPPAVRLHLNQPAI